MKCVSSIYFYIIFFVPRLFYENLVAIESLPFGSYSSVFLGFVRGRERDALILSHACVGAFLDNRCGSVFPFSFFSFFMSFLGCHTVRERLFEQVET